MSDVKIAKHPWHSSDFWVLGMKDLGADGELDLGEGVVLNLEADGELDMGEGVVLDLGADGELDLGASDGELDLGADGEMDLGEDGDLVLEVFRVYLFI